MTFAASRPRAHWERRIAQTIERRAPQAGVSSSVNATASSTPAPEPGVAGTTATTASDASFTKPPQSVKALAGIITILCVVILAIAFWKIRAWRIRKQNQAKAASDLAIQNAEKIYPFAAHMRGNSFIDLEKPRQAVTMPPPVPNSSSGVGWVPQLRSNIALPEPTRPRSQRAKKAWEKNLAKLISPTVSNQDAPPTYASTNMSQAHPPMPPMPMPDFTPSQALPPTPPAALKLNFDGISLPPPVAKAMPSPARTSSYGLRPAPTTRESSSSRNSERKFPRLMTVSTAFDPTMEDELSMAQGETIRLLEEYEDEWCLVQRVGRMDAAKGVVPRFCLAERAEVVPTHPGLTSHGSYRR